MKEVFDLIYMSDKLRKQLKLQILFDDLLEDRKAISKDEIEEYANYLKDLIDISCQEYIDDNIDDEQDE